MSKFEYADYCCVCGAEIDEGYLTNDDVYLMCRDCYSQLTDEQISDYLNNDEIPTITYKGEKTVIKYEIKKDTVEIRNPLLVDYSEQDIIDTYYNKRGFDPVLIASFDTEEEAIAEFNEEYPTTTVEYGSAGKYLLCKIVIFEINQYYDNEDMDFDYQIGSDIKAEAFVSNR